VSCDCLFGVCDDCWGAPLAGPLASARCKIDFPPSSITDGEGAKQLEQVPANPRLQLAEATPAGRTWERPGVLTYFKLAYQPPSVYAVERSMAHCL